MPQKQMAYFTSRGKQPCNQFVHTEISFISANSTFSSTTKLLPPRCDSPTDAGMYQTSVCKRSEEAKLPGSHSRCSPWFPTHVTYLQPIYQPGRETSPLVQPWLQPLLRVLAVPRGSASSPSASIHMWMLWWRCCLQDLRLPQGTSGPSLGGPDCSLTDALCSPGLG